MSGGFFFLNFIVILKFIDANNIICCANVRIRLLVISSVLAHISVSFFDGLPNNNKFNRSIASTDRTLNGVCSCPHIEIEFVELARQGYWTPNILYRSRGTIDSSAWIYFEVVFLTQTTLNNFYVAIFFFDIKTRILIISVRNRLNFDELWNCITIQLAQFAQLAQPYKRLCTHIIYTEFHN